MVSSIHGLGLVTFTPESHTCKLEYRVHNILLERDATVLRYACQLFSMISNLSYDYLVIGLGIQINLNKVEGLIPALKADRNVCTNYVREYVEKTFPAIQDFRGGNAIFTFPNTPIKCAGAPQKIMQVSVTKQPSCLILLSVGIQLNLRRNLVSVDHSKKTATFELLDSEKGEKITYDVCKEGEMNGESGTYVVCYKEGESLYNVGNEGGVECITFVV
ncbi:SQOR-like protein [Mya arenaria]|uniref:SQOR-like protein n=1 Tax=Mya arenaria TaxID=6604 RepID=A0ABY7FEM3_MYAAR|nr:SQOR-like protein [Mya arenaria]